MNIHCSRTSITLVWVLFSQCCYQVIFQHQCDSSEAFKSFADVFRSMMADRYSVNVNKIWVGGVHANLALSGRVMSWNTDEALSKGTWELKWELTPCSVERRWVKTRYQHHGCSKGKHWYNNLCPRIWHRTVLAYSCQVRWYSGQWQGLASCDLTSTLFHGLPCLVCQVAYSRIN